MVNPNELNSSEITLDNQRTGWEIVEAEAGKMNTEKQVAKLKEASAEIKQGTKHNSELQSIYDSVTGAGLEDWEAQWEMQNRFQEFNLALCIRRIRHQCIWKFSLWL